MTLASNLRRIRLRRGLSQQELSYAARVSQVTISNLENAQGRGKKRVVRSPSADTIVRLARALGCTTDDLIMDHRPERNGHAKPAASTDDSPGDDDPGGVWHGGLP